MGILFISHSSKDNARAIMVRDWLRSEGWGEVFLDLDPAEGLAPGQRWQEELKRAGENCAAVLILVSPNWVASTWCQVEFLLAEQLGKRIFPVVITPASLESLPSQLPTKFQFADISTPENEQEGFGRLAIGLMRAGLSPKSFEWPPKGEPDRAVYRGLEPLDVEDAAIFFGRDAAITRGLDELRRMRDGAPERMLVILGASGAGKSSFLRAGLVARLRRDEANFLVLPIIRPDRAAMSGAHGLIAALSEAIGEAVVLDPGADTITAIFAKLRAPIVDRLRRNANAMREQLGGAPPSIVIAIDQTEELYAAENTERESFLDHITKAVAADGNALVIATVRSDSYEALQTDTQLTGLAKHLLNLPPIAAGAFQEVVEGPARLARPPITIEPELTQRLLMDMSASDALPLLAFTLERLQRHSGAARKLTLGDYTDELGGLVGAVEAAVTAALRPIEGPNALAGARALFVPALVEVSADGVKRRVARRADFSEPTSALADRFVNERILVRDRRFIDGEEIETLELAHEALLRQWPVLKSWIDEEHDALRALYDLKAASRAWGVRGQQKNSRDSWLLHRQDRLKEVEAIARRPDFAPVIDAETRAYLDACRRDERGSAGVRRWGRAAQMGCTLVVLAGAAFVGLVILAIMFVPPGNVEEEPAAYYPEPATISAQDANVIDTLGGAANQLSIDRFSGDIEAVGLDPRWALQLSGDRATVQFGIFDSHTIEGVTRNHFARGVTVWDPREGATIVIRDAPCLLLNGVQGDFEALFIRHGVTTPGCAKRGLGSWPLAEEGSSRWQLPALNTDADLQ